MTPDQALILLGLDAQASTDDVARAIASEYRLWQGRTNAVDFEAQTRARRRIRDLGEAERLLLGDRRNRARQPAPTTAPATAQVPAAPPQAPSTWAPPAAPGPAPASSSWAPPQSPVPPRAPLAVGAPIPASTRLVAKVIDLTVIGVVNGIVTGMLGAIGAWPGYGSAGRDLAMGLLTAILSIGYFVAFESTRGQTPGKMATRIEVTDTYGKVPSLERVLKRNCWLGLMLIPVVGWLAYLVAAIAVGTTISNSPTSQGWHDDFAGRTSVLKAA